MRSKETAVVIGGTGFLGRYVVKQLLEQQVNVYVVARNKAGFAALEKFCRPHEFVQIPGDRKDSKFLWNVFALATPDYVFDLAMFDKLDAESLVLALDKSRVSARVIVAGTIAEYPLGRNMPSPVPEDFPLQPQSAYGQGKVAAYQTLLKSGIDFVWAVLPQLWGPHDPYGRDATLVWMCKNSMPIVYRGDIKAAIPDGYVETAAQAMIHLARQTSPTRRRVHTCGLEHITRVDFLKIVARVVKKPLKVVVLQPKEIESLEVKFDFHFDFPLGDFNLVLDTGTLLDIAFRQSTSAKSGIEQTANWHLSQNSKPNPRYLLPDAALQFVERHYAFDLITGNE